MIRTLMSKKNNFQELEAQQAKDYADVTNKVKKSVDNNVSTFSFIGNIVDLYFTKMFDVMFTLTSSTDEESKSDSNKKES